MPDDFTLTVAGRRITTWKTAAITRSVEGIPSAFVFTGAEMFPDDPTQAIAQPGDKCEVHLGSDRVAVGFIDRVTPTIEPGRHDIALTGRGKCQDLVDCSADYTYAGLIGGEIYNTNALDLAQKLCKPFKIAVQKRGQSKPSQIDYIHAALGETPYEIIERACRFSSLLLYESEDGDLVLDDLGTDLMASGFRQGVNVERAAVTYSMEDRFSTYSILWISIDQFRQYGSSVNNRFTIPDLTVSRYRPRIIISEQWMPTEDWAARRAKWELARRIGRSQAITLTCDSWRDSDGQLWQVNKLASLDLPAWKLVGKAWLIGGVTFRKDASGTHADLLLMPPDAFSPQPQPLQMFDWQIGKALQPSPSYNGPVLGTPPT